MRQSTTTVVLDTIAASSLCMVPQYDAGGDTDAAICAASSPAFDSGDEVTGDSEGEGPQDAAATDGAPDVSVEE